MPPKPETFSALSHSAERGESLGGLGVQALLERSLQILPPEQPSAANATALALRACVIAHATEPLRHRLDGLNDFLPIEPTECRAQSDYRCSQSRPSCPQQQGSAAFEWIPTTGAGQTRTTVRVTPQPTASLRGPGPASVVPVLDQRCRRVRAGLQPASAARQRAAAGAHAWEHLRQDCRHRLRCGLRGVLHRGMAGVRPPHCRGRDLLDDLWHLDADERALAHGPSDARLLHHRHRQHHCTGDVAHRIERVVCQPKGVCRDRCGEHREHRLPLVERGGRGPGGLPGADTARVLVDQFAVAVLGGAVSVAQ